MIIRNADQEEIDQLAKIWYDAWQDAHSEIMPAELKRLRTRKSFKEMLKTFLFDVRVAGPVGSPVGFAIIKEDELYQLYVAAEARGTGVAAELISDAENILYAKGFTKIWLGCAIGNDRAARFYEKSGWFCKGTIVYPARTSAGEFPLEIWRYEKIVDRSRVKASEINPSRLFYKLRESYGRSTHCCLTLLA